MKIIYMKVCELYINIYVGWERDIAYVRTHINIYTQTGEMHDVRSWTEHISDTLGGILLNSRFVRILCSGWLPTIRGVFEIPDKSRFARLIAVPNEIFALFFLFIFLSLSLSVCLSLYKPKFYYFFRFSFTFLSPFPIPPLFSTLHYTFFHNFSCKSGIEFRGNSDIDIYTATTPFIENSLGTGNNGIERCVNFFSLPICSSIRWQPRIRTSAHSGLLLFLLLLYNIQHSWYLFISCLCA